MPRYLLFDRIIDSSRPLPALDTLADQDNPDRPETTVRWDAVLPTNSAGDLIHTASDPVFGKLDILVDEGSLHFCGEGLHARVGPELSVIEIARRSGQAIPDGVLLERLILAVGLAWTHPSVVLFHGSAVAVGSGARIFLGESGAGKSTAATRAIVEHDATLLADDLTVVDAAREAALPGAPCVRLHTTGHDEPPGEQLGEAILMGKAWRRLDVTGAPREPVPLEAFVRFERAAHSDGPELRRLGGAEALRALLENTYAFTDAGEEMKQSGFRATAQLARNVPVFHFTWAEESSTIGETVDYLWRRLDDALLEARQNR